VFEACANSGSFECLTFVEELTRQCLALDGAGSFERQSTSTVD
jgi:hypothetical protein